MHTPKQKRRSLSKYLVGTAVGVTASCSLHCSKNLQRPFPFPAAAAGSNQCRVGILVGPHPPDFLHALKHLQSLAPVAHPACQVDQCGEGLLTRLKSARLDRPSHLARPSLCIHDLHEHTTPVQNISVRSTTSSPYPKGGKKKTYVQTGKLLVVNILLLPSWVGQGGCVRQQRFQSHRQGPTVPGNEMPCSLMKAKEERVCVHARKPHLALQCIHIPRGLVHQRRHGRPGGRAGRALIRAGAGSGPPGDHPALLLLPLPAHGRVARGAAAHAAGLQGVVPLRVASAGLRREHDCRASG